MTPSDWIALGALAVAAASIIFGYLNNQANIKARRAEIAIENSIEAYREVVEKLHTLLIEVDRCRAEDINQVSTKTDNFLLVFYKYRLYFPREMGQEIVELTNEIHSLFSKTDAVTEDDHKKFDGIMERLRNFIERLQDHIGLEVEYASVKKRKNKY